MSQIDGILIWRQRTDWSEVIKNLLTDKLTQDVRRELEKSAEDYFYIDTEWSEEIGLMCRDGKELAGCRELQEGINLKYQKIRLFHACRTDDIDSYLNNGLLGVDLSDVTNNAKKIFISDRFPWITTKHIEHAAKDIQNQGREDKIYLFLDEICLIRDRSDYLRYGSESLRIIASRLQKKNEKNCEEYLRTLGKPTIFVCDIPLLKISPKTVFHIIVDLIKWTVNYPYDTATIDCSITFKSLIPPEFIVSYYHPVEISKRFID